MESKIFNLKDEIINAKIIGIDLHESVNDAVINVENEFNPKNETVNIKHSIKECDKSIKEGYTEIKKNTDRNLLVQFYREYSVKVDDKYSEMNKLNSKLEDAKRRLKLIKNIKLFLTSLVLFAFFSLPIKFTILGYSIGSVMYNVFGVVVSRDGNLFDQQCGSFGAWATIIALGILTVLLISTVPVLTHYIDTKYTNRYTTDVEESRDELNNVKNELDSIYDKSSKIVPFRCADSKSVAKLIDLIASRKAKDIESAVHMCDALGSD